MEMLRIKVSALGGLYSVTRFPRAIEKEVFDKAEGVCQICGDDVNFGNGEVEHIISKSQGGSDDIENLQWACNKCNKLKGKKLTNEQVRKKLGLPLNFKEILKLKGKEKNGVSLRLQFEKLYGPIYSILKNATCKEIRTNPLTRSERVLLDKTFSNEPFLLRDSHEEWRLRIRNLPLSEPIPAKFIEHFNLRYERHNGNKDVEGKYGKLYSIFKRVPQKVDEVCIIFPNEKLIIDEKFSTYPDIPSPNLYLYWKEKICPLEITMIMMEHILTLLEHPKAHSSNSHNTTPGLYLIPKEFATKFFQEYDQKRQRMN